MTMINELANKYAATVAEVEAATKLRDEHHALQDAIADRVNEAHRAEYAALTALKNAATGINEQEVRG